MGEKSWQYELRELLDRIRVHFITKRGQVATIVVVQYEAYIDGKWHAIVRFDEAHGFFHRDVMSPTGKQKKTALSIADKNSTLTYALTEIKEKWADYRKRYEEKYYAKR